MVCTAFICSISRAACGALSPIFQLHTSRSAVGIGENFTEGGKMRAIISLAGCLSLICMAGGCSSATDAWPLAREQSVAWNVDPGIPRAVRAPTSHVLLGHLTGRGTATFTLQADPRDSRHLVWVMTDDHGGELQDDSGKVVAHHDTSHWAFEDGQHLNSEIIATVQRPNHVPWTLSKASGREGGGTFASSQYVQQIHTIGAPRSASHDVGATAEASYTADYYFYGAQAAQTRVNRGASY
jgi:hypothetical protein